MRHPGFIPGVPDGGVAVRADDIHTALGISQRPTLITRLAQGQVADTIPGVADALRDTVEPLRPDGAPARASDITAPHNDRQEDAT